MIYGQEVFTSQVLAEAGNIPTPPSTFDDGVVLLASIIVQEGVSTIISIFDERPVIGFRASGLSATATHGNLLGLSADDHPQYLLRDGSAAMTGTFDVGGNPITNVGLVDGVDIPAHASRHLPNGLDPIITASPNNNLTATTTNSEGIQNSIARSDHSHAITTGIVSTQIPDQSNSTGISTNLARADHIHNIPSGTPVTIGTTNSTGSAESFALSDHLHSHGVQIDQTLHAVATQSLNGFMSSTDKIIVDNIATSFNGCIENAFGGSVGTTIYAQWGVSSNAGISNILLGFSGTIIRVTASYISSSNISIDPGESVRFDIGSVSGTTAASQLFTPLIGGTGIITWTNAQDGTVPFTSSGVLNIPVLSTTRLAVGVTEVGGQITPTNAEISIVVWMKVG